MSMMQKIKLKLTDKEIVGVAAKKLGWTSLGQGRHNVGYGNNVDGEGFTTERGHTVVITEEGDVACLDDNVRQEDLNAFKARYGAEKAATDARKAGYSVTEQIIDGKIKIIAREL